LSSARSDYRHSTTTAEAASHKSGKYGKGGDLLYRWGNPRAYRAGTVKDQKLFGQHDSHWIDKGLPGEGHVLIFNNGMRRTGGAHSTVDEIVLPVDAKGHYQYTPGKAFGPDKPTWSYAAPKRTDFYAPFISGAQRLPNGNTLICSGTNGTIFEVTPRVRLSGNTSTRRREFAVRRSLPWAGAGLPFGLLRSSASFSSFLQGVMNLSADQKKQLEAAEKEIGEKLGKLLTDEQQKQFAERPTDFDPKNFPPGQLWRLRSRNV
jgi:hypothetical protein